MVGGAALLVLAAFNGELAARSYPVVLSLGAAVAFGVSLLNPPSMIERFARVRDPDLSPAGQSYCRRVTLIWTAWLSANAAIAALLAVWGDDRAWALWTGLLSYIGMAVLLVGEWLVRPRDKLRGIAR